jgi:hypothetical protein
MPTTTFALEMDQMPHPEVEKRISDKVSMCNYWANRLCGEAADRAMQVHGGIGYSRHKALEHIYRHHRRYRITEATEEIQMRKVAAFLFGYLGARRAEFADSGARMLTTRTARSGHDRAGRRSRRRGRCKFDPERSRRALCPGTRHPRSITSRVVHER